MASSPGPRGPWTHRLLVVALSIAAGLLFFWLLDFATGDLASLPGPDWTAFEREHLDQALVAQQAGLVEEQEATRRQIQGQGERQDLLRRSTENSRETMNQLLEMQRLALQQGVKPSAAEQAALAESQQLFLSNQRRFQALNEEIVALTEQQRAAEARIARQEKRLEELRLPVREEYGRLARRHELRLAALQLAVLLPLLALTAYLLVNQRGKPFAPLAYAAGIAVACKVALVMHQYFPSRYFKYVALLAVLAVVVKLLVHLLRAAARPARAWLLRRYREAYEQFRCPTCNSPIRRGPLKFLLRTKRAVVNPAAAAGDADPGPYTCPACGERLYEECGACHATRTSLLPWCERCGAEKPLAP